MSSASRDATRYSRACSVLKYCTCTESVFRDSPDVDFLHEHRQRRVHRETGVNVRPTNSIQLPSTPLVLLWGAPHPELPPQHSSTAGDTQTLMKLPLFRYAGCFTQGRSLSTWQPNLPRVPATPEERTTTALLETTTSARCSNILLTLFCSCCTSSSIPLTPWQLMWYELTESDDALAAPASPTNTKHAVALMISRCRRDFG